MLLRGVELLCGSVLLLDLLMLLLELLMLLLNGMELLPRMVLRPGSTIGVKVVRRISSTS